MIRITFPYLLLISMTGFCGAILNSYGRFAVPAFTPVFLNLSLIFAATIAAPWFEEPVFALAWGVFFAGVVRKRNSCGKTENFARRKWGPSATLMRFNQRSNPKTGTPTGSPDCREGRSRIPGWRACRRR